MTQSKDGPPPVSASTLETSSLSINKTIKLTPLTQPTGKQLDLTGKVETLKTDIKFNEEPTSGIPDPDDRYKYFFRVKIGGVSTVGQAAAQPTASDAVAASATSQTAGKEEYKVKQTIEGGASFYGDGDGFNGKKTASGEIFDTTKLTAAHKTLPFGTQVRVTNKANNKSAIVKINDRGPYIAGRIIDLSLAAAKAIDMVSGGHADVKVEVLEKQAASKPISTTPDPTKPDSTKPEATAPKPAPANQPATTKSPLTPDTKSAFESSSLTVSKGTKLTPFSNAPKSPENEIDLTGKKIETLQTDIKFDDKNLPDTPREFIFDSLLGDIIIDGKTPYISLSSHQHSTAKFVIHDPDDTLRPQIAKLENVEIEAGFVNGYKLSKFVGLIYNIGRRLPGGTEIEAIDVSAPLAATGTGAVSSVNENPSANAATPDAATPSSFKVKSTFTGDASFYGKGDGFHGKQTANGETFDTNKMTAAHPSLPFGTIIRVTNTKNNKSVIVRVNDRGPYAAGRVIDLSYAAAQAIDIVSAGHGAIKGEVLDAPKGTEVDQGKTPAKPAASKPVAPSSQTALAPDKPAAQTTTTPKPESTTTSPKQSLAKVAVEGTNLKIAPEQHKLQKQGATIVQQSPLSAAEQEAALQGKVLAVRGNTVTPTAPGEGKPSGVILDYAGNRSAFIGHPVVTKRTNRQLQSGYGAIAVQYYNMNNKQVEGAVVNTPAPVSQHPTGVITAPQWGTTLLSQKIDGQEIYTWADATKNGSRVPASKEIMQGIIRIARILAPLTKEAGQSKFTVTSWYRDPANNTRVGGAVDSRHLYGDAVDFYFDGPGYEQLFKKLWADGENGSGGWKGGVAKGGGFIHLDDRGSQGQSRSRWYY
jgi:rare lipoprotein A